MSGVIELEMSLPHESLNPNARVIHFEKAKRVKEHRTEAWLVALNWLNTRRVNPPRWKAASIRCHFFFATKRRRDKDNADASMKAARDGLADAGLVDNDAAFTSLPSLFSIDPVKPRVVIEIAEAALTQL